MLLTQRGEARRELIEEGTFAYTKGTDSITLWPVHCVSAAVMETNHMQPPFFTSRSNKYMQDGYWTQIFH